MDTAEQIVDEIYFTNIDEVMAVYEGELLAEKISYEGTSDTNVLLCYNDNGLPFSSDEWKKLSVSASYKDYDMILNCAFNGEAFTVNGENAIDTIQYGDTTIQIYQGETTPEFELTYYAVFEYQNVCYELKTYSNDKECIYEILQAVLGVNEEDSESSSNGEHDFTDVLGYRDYHVTVDQNNERKLVKMEEKAKKIIEACMQEKSKNPIEIFRNIAHMNFVRMHGPEHHVLDGAALLTAFYNAGGQIELQVSLNEIVKRGLQMPGATCGMWGVCGAVSSMGAALSIIDGTGPLSMDNSWGKHMEFTSGALYSLSQIGGPRCCKRDAFLSFQKAIEHINENYDVKLDSDSIACCFNEKNEQCIKEKCPFYRKLKKKVAFICVHNSCRSQIAEALGKHLASAVFESYSAGTETKPQINQDAVRLMKALYGIDMEKTQYSKMISDIPNPDIAISMGCNVGCPFIGRVFDDNWGLEDPTGKSDEEFMKIIKEIEFRILQLREELM